MTDRTPRVLHVSCAGGGGTDAILRGYPTAMPEVDHRFLLKPGVPVPCRADGDPCDADVVPTSLRAGASAVRAAVRRHQPHVVHAHSSWAGAIARAVVGDTPVVYTPHCYATERSTQPRPVAAAVAASERLLARRTAAVIAVSPREAALARHLGVGGEVEVAFQCFEDRPEHHAGVDAPVHETSALDVVSCGRVEPQKDPGALVGVAHRCDPSTTFTWIGSGDPALAAGLAEAGIAVTGWLEPAATRSRLAAADVLVHVARWEGFPLVVFEAIRAGRPAVVLDRPYLRGTGLPGVEADLGAVARSVDRLADPTARRDLLARQQRWYDDVRAGRPEHVIAELYLRLAGIGPSTRPAAG